MSDEIWEYDKVKYDFIENVIGFEVLVIWESEYKQNKEKTIQRCIEFLEN